MKRNRRKYAVAAIAIAGALGLSACSTSPDTGDRDSGVSSVPVSGGSVTWAVAVEPSTLNPQQNGQMAAAPILRNLYDSYLSADEEGNFHPWLASGYQYSPDGKTLTLTLREGVTFTDGDPLTSDAVVANFVKLRDPAYGSNYAGRLAALDTVEATDAHIVTFSFTRPDASFLQFLSSTSSSPLSPTSLGKDKDVLKAGGTDIAGTGPFSVAEYQAKYSLTLERNPDYNWAPEDFTGRQGPAYLDQLVYRFLPEDATRVNSLSSKQVDAVYNVPGNFVEQVKRDTTLDYGEISLIGVPQSIFFNVSKAPFEDPRVREAFQLGVDRDLIIDRIFAGTVEQANTPYSQHSPFYDKSLEGVVKFDPDRANRLLDEAGWEKRDDEGYRVKDSRRLTVRALSPADLATTQVATLDLAIGDSWRKNIGAEYSNDVLETGLLIDRVKNNEYELWRVGAESGDPAAAFDAIYYCSDPARGFSCVSKLDDPTAESYLDQALATTDPAERKEIYSRFQERVFAEERVSLPLYLPNSNWAVDSRVHGTFVDFGNLGSSYNLWVEH